MMKTNTDKSHMVTPQFLHALQNPGSYMDIGTIGTEYELCPNIITQHMGVGTKARRDQTIGIQ
jgi:hypothetical protein